MQLSKKTIKDIKPQPGLIIPDEKLFSLPEKVLQFGTGVLLRGLPDYFIDKANRNGIFNGRVVIVKSTSHGSTDAFDQQDGLYTVCIKGIENGQDIDETIINSSISRVISANENWDSILECAHSPEMQIIISNTTEVGIILTEDDIGKAPPLSFPGKLLAFLYERYKAFKGAAEKGMVVVPTELIVDNGNKLRSIVLELAKMNKLDDAFISWLQTANHFCNSLVDRIVPGKLPEQDKKNTEAKLGYSDDLMIMAECFCLWAIESDNARVKQMLSFSQTDEGMVIAPSIEKFRELKLRLLNGTHTFSCGLAHLSKAVTVKEAMNDKIFSSFVENLKEENAEALADENISFDEATEFGKKVLDRFRNPYLDHQWLNICVQYSSKMKMRNVPLLLKHYSKTNEVPEYMALGFAAFLLFMKCSKNDKGQYEGTANGTSYIVQDDNAAYFADKWQDNGADAVAEAVLSDSAYWGPNLSKFPGFTDAVKLNLNSLIKNGVIATIHRTQLNKKEA